MSADPTPHQVPDDVLVRAIVAHRRVLPDAYAGVGLTVREEGAMKDALLCAYGSLFEQLETAQQRVAFWKNQARRARMTDGICGVTVDSSWHEPVACAFGPDHEGDHSWASIPAHNPASRQDR